MATKKNAKADATMSQSPVFSRLRVRPDALAAFGFRKSGRKWSLNKPLVDGAFDGTVTIEGENDVSTRLVDVATGEDYTLHLMPSATGAFVGRVRSELDALLADIARECFKRDVFKSELAREIVAYAREHYDDELEFLWQQFPEDAILRRKDTEKWYLLIVRVPGGKLGLPTDGKVEAIDLRVPPESADAIAADSRLLPGYHMNKKSWFTIVLDGSVPKDEILAWLRRSYELAVGKAKK